MDIEIKPLEDKKKKEKYSDESTLGFGKVFTDRMFVANWRPEKGWFNAQIKPYEPFILDPSSLIFHYAQEIFEGLKAYKWENGTLALFRPEMNARRFNLSAERLCMPEVPEEFFLEAIKKLVFLEQDWIPSSIGTSLYIRPAMIGDEPILGVRPSAHYTFFIILSPVGPYYVGGFNPVKIMVEDKYVRAAPGGTGEAKTGGNYSSTLKAFLEAKKKGFDQVVWLDSVERRYIEEVGAMNMFFVYQDRIVTPLLDGSILHGVTRDSVLKLSESFGYKTEERKIPIEDLLKDIASGDVKEAFGSGTAAVITPVGVLSYKGKAVTIGNGKVGTITQKLYDTLTQIQYGKMKDPFNWIKTISHLSYK